MLGQGKRTRRFQHRLTLTFSPVVIGELGHAVLGDPVDVKDVYASVTQMSSTQTAMTFQLADVIGLDIEFRAPGVEFNGLRYNGHLVHFASPEVVDERGRYIRIQGWYQIDNPLANA